MRERRVERVTVVEADPERVWEALTDDELLSDWFADEAEIDPVEGGDVSFTFGDERRQGTVHRVEEPRELDFSWSRSGGDESLVTFRLEPVETGTRVVVVERALTAPGISASAGPQWAASMRRLRLTVGALVPA